MDHLSHIWTDEVAVSVSHIDDRAMVRVPDRSAGRERLRRGEARPAAPHLSGTVTIADDSLFSLLSSS